MNETDRHSDEVLRSNQEMAEQLLDAEEGDVVEVTFVTGGEEKTTRQKVIDVTQSGFQTDIFAEDCPGWNGPSIQFTVGKELDPELKPTLRHPFGDTTIVQEYVKMRFDPEKELVTDGGQSDDEQRDNECQECGHVEQTHQDVGDGKAYCCSECGEVWKIEHELVADGGEVEATATPRTDICEGCDHEIVAEVERVEGKHELIHGARTAEEGFMSVVGGSVEVRYSCRCSSVTVEYGPGTAKAWEFPDAWMWSDDFEEVADRVA